jgi:hypothetical protein
MWHIQELQSASAASVFLEVLLNFLCLFFSLTCNNLTSRLYHFFMCVQAHIVQLHYVGQSKLQTRNARGENWRCVYANVTSPRR